MRVDSDYRKLYSRFEKINLLRSKAKVGGYIHSVLSTKIKDLVRLLQRKWGLKLFIDWRLKELKDFEYNDIERKQYNKRYKDIPKFIGKFAPVTSLNTMTSSDFSIIMLKLDLRFSNSELVAQVKNTIAEWRAVDTKISFNKKKKKNEEVRRYNPHGRGRKMDNVTDFLNAYELMVYGRKKSKDIIKELKLLLTPSSLNRALEELKAEIVNKDYLKFYS